MHRMENKEQFYQIIDEKFTDRLEVSAELHRNLMAVPFQIKKQKNFSWFVAAGLLLLISVNIFAIQHSNFQSKKQFIESQYNSDIDNTISYE